MKKLLLSIACAGAISLGYAQEYNSSYFGIKAGVNHSTNTYGPEINGIETSFKDLGFAGGVYYNRALGEKISLQPELLFSVMGSDLKNTNTNPNGTSILKLNYISIPVLFKWTPVWRFGLFAGPQLDFLVGASNKPNGEDKVSQIDNFDLYDFAGTVGAEFFITRNVGVYARYMQGLNNIFDQSSPSWAWPASVDEVKNHGWQFGVTVALRGKKKAEPTSVAPAPVTPVVDTDADGIADAQDKCPTVKGTAKYQGCPVPDTDGDGINDESDKCPAVAGTAKYAGCPVPDTDGDGVNDEMDKCPKVVGLAGNMGCPELIVYFQRAEAGLTADDKVSLDKVVTFMNNNPTLNIIVEGHTSALGEDAFNQTLSEKRAAESVDYLVSKGISKSRLTSVGYGEKFPIGDNSIEDGRAKSRRVVIKIAQ